MKAQNGKSIRKLQNPPLHSNFNNSNHTLIFDSTPLQVLTTQMNVPPPPTPCISAQITRGNAKHQKDQEPMNPPPIHPAPQKNMLLQLNHPNH